MNAPKHTAGATVSNGHWVGMVIAATRDWAWVQPIEYVLRGPKNEAIPYSFTDGPLTFRHRDLSATGEAGQ